MSSNVPVAQVYSNNSQPVLAPDPIVTGTAPSSAGWTTAGGTRITLGPGETIYNLSKRYGVPASEIIKANGISDPSKVASGRQLLIPVYVYSRQAPVSAPDSNPKTRSAKSSAGLQGEARQDNLPMPVPAPHRDAAVLPAAPSLRNPSTGTMSEEVVSDTASNTKAPASAGGAYTVKSGDTLSKIAREQGVGIDALKSANNISGSNIRIGQSLVIPGAGSQTPDQTSTASIPTENAPKSYTPPVSAAADGVAAKTKADVASIAPAATGIGKLRWPARGQVITGFAKSENGKRNDGIDISMPAGTPIKAAENGVVIYSGDGLKEYGKTVLVRHDDGLVTVYAHAQTLNVNRGDKVVRGQVVASSGMTGAAKTPRLHFEVRKNAAPVDPTTYLE
ncbi:peptidoglycan DD-metalloendopeptidase family protein [Hoeflea ulvae]|uniref:Peptidoglycan DD-metalloendopeptidase family protein n=1 Tax=Hoeflea ulvae TaxID=2983764 RepID=A0ABT3YH30_9HYPH|nr:peptidoglycan DD-metalloendopeptidase family protein [Hoeflea ulvae]MCY0095212.1 peptidoglycan DD-metalloendopeptidase family protein [Hoeflea ulvae]